MNIAFFEQFLSSLAILDFPEQEVALREMMFPFIAVTTTFRDVSAYKSDATYVTQADYTITYSDGDSVRLGGTGTIVVL